MSLIIFKIVTACLSTAAFSIVYHLRPQYIIYSSLASFVACTPYLLLSLCDIGIFMPIFISTVLMVIFVEIVSRVKKIPSSIIQIPGILPLIPGRILYYTMSYILKEDYANAFIYAAELVKTSLAIAIGITVTSVCFRWMAAVLHKQTDN